MPDPSAPVIVGAAAIHLALSGHGEATGGWQSGSP